MKCYDDAGKDEFLSTDFPYTPAGLADRQDAVRAWGQACAENTGPLLGNVDTQSAARDMDMLRAALGDDKLNYLGFSYGTQLGATYAGLFPDRSGRLVLDGALDTTLASDEVALQQAEGFESALRAYVTDCQASSDCPLTGDVTSGLQQIQAMVEDAEPNPIPTSSGRAVTKKLAFYGVAVTMYDEASWSFLTQALQEVLWEGKGDDLLYLADVYNDRSEDGTFKSNSEEAFRAINCADSRAEEDMGTMRAARRPDRGGGTHARRVLRVLRHRVHGLAVPAGEAGVRPGREGRAADRRRRHHQRPRHPVPLGRGALEDALVGRPGHVRGRGPHGVRAVEHLRRRGRGGLPGGGHRAGRRPHLLIRRRP